MKRKAVFITIEGLEGSGKSTTIKFIVDFLKVRSLSVAVFRDPGSTKIGERIRKILLDRKSEEISIYTELLLYLAARTQLIEEKLKKALKVYDFVICDRFFDSTIVYQGYASGLGKIVYKLADLFSLGITPDLTIVIDTPVKEGLKRIKHKDRMELKPLAFHKKLKEGYLTLAKKNPRRIKVVNGRGELKDINRNIEALLNGLLEARCRREKANLRR
jgi:dTMP kinase